MAKRYYIAYGSNMNKKQMRWRCSDAVAEGTAYLENYTLVFRGYPNTAVATVEPKFGSRVPLAVWSISKADEESLDVYEGFPRLYIKQDFIINLHGESIIAMAYIMTPGRDQGKPCASYLATIAEGYLDFGFTADDLGRTIAGSKVMKAIETYAAQQTKSYVIACPRCGRRVMKQSLHTNALSRRADIYICDSCGAEEAYKDFAGCIDLISDWCIADWYKEFR